MRILNAHQVPSKRLLSAELRESIDYRNPTSGVPLQGSRASRHDSIYGLNNKPYKLHAHAT